MIKGFFGEYECKLDDKNRLVLPARLKSEITSENNEEEITLILCKGFEPCLNLYLPSTWESVILEKMRQLDFYHSEHRALQRTFLGGSTEVSMDKTGRILLPRLMQKYALLEKDLLIVGVDQRIEIWNPDKYQEYILTGEQFSQAAHEYLTKPTIQPISKVFNISLQENQSKAVD
ncbi:MAG: division/cell wall cluster transcriptional repressor MraZ [Cytophagales bacterium]|nr:division/cell wall cluster transcriptional repressor MraZ [Cytophagales bacterium]MDW8383729.1 division/cell wall cluster transcriptional repressor MraZ [Flammeovirgaceae bacterium]